MIAAISEGAAIGIVFGVAVVGFVVWVLVMARIDRRHEEQERAYYRRLR
jgi:hypothetical protein